MINTIVEGDCINVLDKIKLDSVDLIYLDPPFFTHKEHRLKNKERTKEFSFDDTWLNENEYAEFLFDRLQKMHGVLKDTGSIFVHCDKSAEHIIRALLDRVFGRKNFQSEIIWHYKRWSGSKKGLLPTHQNIYFYSKSKSFKFNRITTPYSETTNLDQILQNRTRDAHNKSVYKIDSDGNTSISGEKKGVPLGDVWDIPYLNPKAKERVGYPTQKPLLLLDKIIELTTNENDIVLDPFCGSGTTCVSAKLLKRKFIGIDKSKDAVNLSYERINSPVKTESGLLKNGRSSYLTANKIGLQLLNGIEFNPVHRNKGIDAILVKQFEGKPVLVKIQKKSESIGESLKLLRDAMTKKKSSRSFLIKTHGNSLFNDEYEDIIVIDSPSSIILDSM